MDKFHTHVETKKQARVSADMKEVYICSLYQEKQMKILRTTEWRMHSFPWHFLFKIVLEKIMVIAIATATTCNGYDFPAASSFLLFLYQHLTWEQNW